VFHGSVASMMPRRAGMSRRVAGEISNAQQI
jgi:hypothetical protein